jgi:predicted ATP-grasp superfamily ATP-dependent carboligase
VIGGYVNGLGMVRALAAHGIPVAVVTTKPYDIAHRSRFVVAHRAVVGLEEHPEALLEVLDGWSRERAGWLVLPTNDEALVALSRHRERLAAHYRVAAPPFSVVRQLVDKSLLLDAARACGIAVPHRYAAATLDAVDDAGLRFPVLVKPIAGYRFFARFGCKLFVARDRDELRRSVERLRAAGLEGEIFDLVPGADDRLYAYCTYIGESGEAAPGVTVRKLRQSPPFFGVARVAEVVEPIAELRAATVAVLRRIGFRGIASAEFKLDPRDGRFRFLEVNGRVVLYNGLLRAAGLDLAALAWAEHVGGAPPTPAADGWRGVWINVHADLLYAILARRDERLGVRALIEPYSRPRVDAVWSSHDPYPFLAQWAHSLRLGARALLSRDQRARLVQPSSPGHDA